MGRILDGIEPINVLRYFEDICEIPHGSGNMEGIRKYILDFASSNSLIAKSDAIGNIVIYKDATPGYEHNDKVIIQAHMDMACAKSFELEGKFDFDSDSLNIATMDDYIFARGTSLGADNGIGVAYILSILSDNSIDHPQIEAIFTVDAINGMKGAFALDKSLISGKRLINLDHTSEGELLTSSAGGRKVKCILDVSTIEHTGIKFNLVICGLEGGHSGIEIDKGRGNANLLMGRFIHYIAKTVPIKIGYLKGGLDDSVIPREAKTEIYVEENKIEIVETLISEFVSIIEKEYGDVEDNLTIYGQNMGVCTSLVLDDMSQRKVSLILNDLPDGIIKMSRNGDDLVQTSLNCGIMRLSRHVFELFINIRSLVDSEKEALSDKIQYLIEFLGGKYEIESDYPAWEYNEESDFRELAFDMYQRCFERNPRVTGFHSGLECGIFYDRFENIDIISFGPNINKMHTVNERINIPSIERMYEYLLEILANS